MITSLINSAGDNAFTAITCSASEALIVAAQDILFWWNRQLRKELCSAKKEQENCFNRFIIHFCCLRSFSRLLEQRLEEKQERIRRLESEALRVGNELIRERMIIQ